MRTLRQQILEFTKSRKGEMRGGKYYRRVPKAGGGFRYFYTREQYLADRNKTRKRDDTHLQEKLSDLVKQRDLNRARRNDMETAIRRLPLKQLEKLASIIQDRLSEGGNIVSDLPVVKTDAVFARPSDSIPGYTRSNGGWYKEVRGIDEGKRGGFALLGDFVHPEGSQLRVTPGRLYIDCSIKGSRKYPIKQYTLFTHDKSGNANVVYQHEYGVAGEPHEREWALSMQKHIKEYWHSEGVV